MYIGIFFGANHVSVAVAAAEGIVHDRAGIKGDVGAIDIGCIATAIKVAYGSTTVVHFNHGNTYHGGSIAAAIDFAQNNGRVAVVAIADGHLRVAGHFTFLAVLGTIN